MKLTNKYSIDLRSVSISQLPGKMMNDMEMILPGASTSTLGSSSCSCGAAALKNKI